MFCYPIWFLIHYLLIVILFAVGFWAVFPENFHIMHTIAFILFYLTTILVLSTLKCFIKHEVLLDLGPHFTYNETITALPTSSIWLLPHKTGGNGRSLPYHNTKILDNGPTHTWCPQYSLYCVMSTNCKNLCPISSPSFFLHLENSNYQPCYDVSSFHCPHWGCESIGLQPGSFWINHNNYIHLNITHMVAHDWWPSFIQHFKICLPQSYLLLPKSHTYRFQTYGTYDIKMFITLNKGLHLNMHSLSFDFLSHLHFPIMLPSPYSSSSTTVINF